MSVVYSGGTYDLLHIGHIELLRASRELAGPHGKVVVALNGDDFVERFKGRRPVCTWSERRAVLEATKYVDLVVANVDDEDSKPSIEVIRPDIIIGGSDWDAPSYKIQMDMSDEWLGRMGIELVFIPRTTGVSTSLLRTRAQPG